VGDNATPNFESPAASFAGERGHDPCPPVRWDGGRLSSTHEPEVPVMSTVVLSEDLAERRSGPDRRWGVLAIVCVAVAAINLDSTIVNVTLPALVRELHASTSRLQWVVDAYQLSFAALVLAAGSLSDRFGRKGALMTGLALFGSASVAGAFATTSGQLIAARIGMGVGAAIVFPNTLSIISNVFIDRAERAKAIGIWGAATGMGIASGPILGGWLLEHFWWGSALLCMMPIAAVGLVLVAMRVPTSRDPAAPRLDGGGLVLSTLGLGALVYTIIEGPVRGWTDPLSIAGFAAAALVGAAFVAWERRADTPMLDVGLFRNLRFSAASGSVTVAYFARYRFIFMVTMYFQFMLGWSPFSYGLRLLPVAISIGAASAVGTTLAVRVGNKAVVAGGLACMAVGFAWISRSSLHTSTWKSSAR
jgi:EmrB/QacA subfamily drug resistance transporter